MLNSFHVAICVAGVVDPTDADFCLQSWVLKNLALEMSQYFPPDSLATN